MIRTRFSYKDHLGAVLGVALLSVLFGGLMEFEESRAAAPQPPIGFSGKTYSVSSAQDWKHALFANAELVR